MYEYTVLRRRFVFAGNELAQVKISVPETDIPRDMAEFYSNMSKNFIKWCEETEFPLLCEEYNGASKEKYIYRKKLYFLSAEISYRTETLISVITRVGEGRSVIFSEYECWDAESSLMLPPKYALARLRRELKGADIPKFSKKIRSVGTNGSEIFLR